MVTTALPMQQFPQPLVILHIHLQVLSLPMFLLLLLPGLRRWVLPVSAPDPDPPRNYT